jgi:4-hydroxy-tetrahydrodipicolinate synthase
LKISKFAIIKNFNWLSGEDATAVAYNANGGNGCISVTANIAPKLCAEVQLACEEGNFKKALEIQELLMPLHTALFEEPNPTGAKYAASLLGLCTQDCKVPLLPLEKTTQQKIEKAMKDLNL